MKINFLMMWAIGSYIVSCNTSSHKAPVTENPFGTDTLPCYGDTTNGDKVFLQLHITGNEITGELNYQISGKDQNTGFLQGAIKGDTLLADYSFLSEGVQSIRQVIFLKKGNSLLEGYGEVEEVNGKMIFKKEKELTFGNGIILEKIQCEE